MTDPARMEAFVDSVRVLLQRHGTAWLTFEQFMAATDITHAESEAAKERVAEARCKREREQTT